MVLSDLHIHTSYCDGKSTVEETVKEAVKKNMVSAGFSSHGYTPFDTSYCIKRDDIKNYIKEVKDISLKYKDKIEVYCGIEQDFYGSAPKEDFDYVIGSVHYIQKNGEYLDVDLSEDFMKKTVKEHFGGNYLKYVKAYYDTMSELCERTNPDIIGHFDLVSKFNYPNKYFDEDSKAYQSTAYEALKCVSEGCGIIEMNTGAISRGYRPLPYPASFLLKFIKALKMEIILSSDSHDCKNLCFGFEDCIKLLKENKINSVVILKNGKFTQIGI